MSGAISSAVRRVLSNWRNPLLPPPTPGHLEAIRMHEIGSVIPLMPIHGRVLEIGAGTGWQARALAQQGFEVEAIDLPTSLYAESRVWPVQDYDGVSIPFPSDTFDVVFSSSTLEHIPHLRAFLGEMRRVLREGGIAIHIVPSAAWRFWTSLTHPVRYLTLPFVHGEHASNVATEMLAFRRKSWADLFSETGWVVESCRPGGLFYTGSCVADRRLSTARREQLSRSLGSAVHIFVLGVAPGASGRSSRKRDTRDPGGGDHVRATASDGVRMTQVERLLIVVGSLSPGGTERVAALLAGHWAGEGVGVSLLTYAGDKPDHYPLPPAVRRLRINLLWESTGLISRIWSEIRRRRQLRTAIADSRPDFILSFGEATNVRVLSASFGLRIPVIVSERVDPRQYAVPRSWHLLRKLLYPLARYVVVQTESVAHWARTFLSESRVRVIPNPVHPLAQESGRPAAMDERRCVIAIGRLAEQKGFDLLLQAYARSKLPEADWQLVILGDGPEHDSLRRQIEQLGLQGSVLMPGVVKSPEQWLQHAELFVLSSRFEGFPNALLEAMQCGLPVATFDCPSGPGEIVRHEQTGLLVPASDVDALAAAMARLASDTALRQRLGSAAAVDVTSRFSIQHVASMWEELLVDVAGATQ